MLIKTIYKTTFYIYLLKLHIVSVKYFIFQYQQYLQYKVKTVFESFIVNKEILKMLELLKKEEDPDVNIDYIFGFFLRR